MKRLMLAAAFFLGAFPALAEDQNLYFPDPMTDVIEYQHKAVEGGYILYSFCKEDRKKLEFSFAGVPFYADYELPNTRTRQPEQGAAVIRLVRFDKNEPERMVFRAGKQPFRVVPDKPDVFWEKMVNADTVAIQTTEDGAVKFFTFDIGDGIKECMQSASWVE